MRQLTEYELCRVRRSAIQRNNANAMIYDQNAALILRS
jgi:hypothetical protein